MWEKLKNQPQVAFVVNGGLLLLALEELNHLHSEVIVQKLELLNHDLFKTFEVSLPLNCQHAILTTLELKPILVGKLQLRFFLFENTLVALTEGTCQFIDLVRFGGYGEVANGEHRHEVLELLMAWVLCVKHLRR